MKKKVLIRFGGVAGGASTAANLEDLMKTQNNYV